MRFTTATVAIAALLSAASTSIVADDSSASARAIRRRRRVNSSKALKLNAQAQDVFQNSAVAEGKDEVAEAAAMKMKKGKGGYEVWGADQSNSVAGETPAGVKGSFLWVWDSESIADQLAGGADATPLSCTPNDTVGPCNLLDIFPQDLKEVGSHAALEDLTAFGRLHGVINDPSNLYVTANIFAPSGGYVGIIDTKTKEAIALFRVTKTTGNASGRSVHMSFWSTDGSAILVDNLHGKMIERIDVTRDKKGKIIDLVFNKSAGVYLGTGFSAVAEATAFNGNNAFGNPLIGSVSGSYADA
eukprot:scaffold2499_cov70-Skeletonema_dohrnii-CCMP3373.AAC.1